MALVWPLPSPAWQVGTAVLGLFAPIFPFTLRLTRRLPRQRARPWLLAGYLWFGFAAYFLLGAIASQLAVAFGAHPRDAAIVCGAAAIAVVLAGLVNVARGPTVHRVRIPLAGLRAPVHDGAAHRRPHRPDDRPRLRRADGPPGQRAVARRRRDHRRPRRRPRSPSSATTSSRCADLRARDGVFAITGNHEYYWNADAWLVHLRSLGIRMLHNEHVTVAARLHRSPASTTSPTARTSRARSPAAIRHCR